MLRPDAAVKNVICNASGFVACTSSCGGEVLLRNRSVLHYTDNATDNIKDNDVSDGLSSAETFARLREESLALERKELATARETCLALALALRGPRLLFQ